MGKTEIMNNISRKFNLFGLKAKKHSPEILIAAGVVGVVSSAVMACKATTKLSAILEESKEQIDLIHEGTEKGEIRGKEYTPEDGKKDLTITYTQTGIKIAKLYAPSVILGALSLTGIVMSHRILTKRNVALAAAYTAIDKGFKEYRGRVVERFGKELDKELRFDIKAKEIEETVTNEKGEEEVVKSTVLTVNGVEYSDYAKFFDETNVNYVKDAELNLYFLKEQQAYANKILKEKGHIFLNEVYDLIGISRTKAGQIVGWVYDPKNPDIDSYVDFGIYNLDSEAARMFVNGNERAILLDFNPDGNIYELLN